LLDVPKLVGLINIPSFEDEEISDEGLAELLSFVNAAECGAAYRCWLTTLTHSHQIHEAKRLLRAIDMLRRGSNAHVTDIIRCSLADAVRDHRCFADHHQQLLCICLFSSVEANHLESWERTLVTEIWKYLVQQVASALAATLSRTLFGDVEDNMNTHANACVCKTLDVLFGVFGGSLQDDENCPCSPVVIRVVKELSLEFITLQSVLEGIGGAIGSGDERWMMAQLVLGEQDALEAANRVAFGEDYSCELCSISNNRLVLTAEGLERLCRKGSSGAVVTEQISTRALPALSAEEELASCYVTRIARGGSVTMAEWEGLVTLGWKAEYDNFFRMSVSLRAVLACHIAHEDGASCVEAIASELCATNQANATGGFLFHFMHMRPADLADALAAEAPQQPSLLTVRFRMRPIASYMAQSAPQELVDVLASRCELRHALLHTVEPLGWSAFHVLAEKSGAHLVQLLLQNQVRAEEVMEILRWENRAVPERTTVWWFLAQSHGRSLAELLRARSELCSPLLPLANFAGWSAFHVLAEHYPLEFVGLLLHLDSQDLLWAILSRPNEREPLQAVWWFFTEKSGAAMAELMRQRPEVRRRLVHKVNPSGWSALHNLAEHYGLALTQLLESLPEDEALEVLGLVNEASEEKTAVWWFYARLNGQHLVSLLRARPALQAPLARLASPAGWTPLHVLAEHWGEALAGLLVSLGSEEAARVLEMGNTVYAENATVGCTLAKHHAPHFLALAAASAELRARVLGLERCTAGGWSCWHVLAEWSAPALLRLLASASLDDHAVLKLLATGSERARAEHELAAAGEGVCVWNFLVRDHSAGLAELLGARGGVRQGVAGLRSEEGRGALSVLASQPRGSKAMGELLRALPEDEVLSILQAEDPSLRSVLGVMASESKPQLAELLLARPELREWAAGPARAGGWSAWHLLAAGKERVLTPLLLALDDDEARRVLGLVNAQSELQIAVWWTLAEDDGAAMAELMGARPAVRAFLAPLANLCGWSAMHVLAEHWGEALAGLLATLGGEEVLRVLASANELAPDKTAVWWFLAKHNGPHLLQLLAARAEVRAGLLSLADPRGWSAYHVLAEHHGEASKGLLAAVGGEEAQRILELRNEQHGSQVWRMMPGGGELLAVVLASQSEA